MKVYPCIVDCDKHGVSTVVEAYPHGSYAHLWPILCNELGCECPAGWSIVLANGSRLSYAEARRMQLIHIDNDPY